MQLRFGLAGFAMSNMIAAVGDELVGVLLAICPMCVCVCAYTWLNSLLLPSHCLRSAVVVVDNNWVLTRERCEFNACLVSTGGTVRL